MINSKTFGSISLLASDINKANIRLGTVDGSALSILVQAGFTPLEQASQLNPEEFVEHYQTSLERGLGTGAVNKVVTAGTELIPVAEHEETLLHLKKSIGGLMNGILDRSRNQVQPFITSILRSAEEIPNRADIVKSLYDFISIGFAERWNDPIVHKMLTAVGDVPVVDFNHDYQPLKYPHVDAETGILTGHARYDEIIKETLTAYNYSFKDLFDWAGKTEFPHISSVDALTSFDRYLAVLLIHCAMEEKPWANTKCSMDEFRAMMMGNTNKIAAWVRDYLAYYGDAIDNKRLIAGTKAVDGVTLVYVYAPVMDDFVSRGGSVEALQGMFLMETDPGAVSNGIEFFNEGILANLSKYIVTWERHTTIRKNDDNQAWLEGVRTALIRGFRDAITANPDLFSGHEATSRAIDLFRTYVYDKVQMHNLDSIEDTIMDAVEEIVFTGEQTVQILRNINFFVKDGMPKEEAINQAALGIVFEWFVSQVTVDE